MANLKIALKAPETRLSEPYILIEGPGSWNIKRPEEFASKFRNYLDDLKHLKYLEHLEFVTEKLSDEEKKKLSIYQKIAADVQSNIMRSFGSAEDSILGIHNLFENLELILQKPDLNHLKVKKPFRAAVLSAGPSLNLAINELKEIQNKCLLVCVDACFKHLLENGIHPHIVVSMERDDYGIKFFRNLPPNASQSLLMVHATVKKELLDAFPGNIATTLKFTGPFLWLPLKRTQVWTASSSAHLAYRICVALGAEEIALIGQDLSFHPDTLQSHCEVSDYPEWSQKSDSDSRIRERKAFYVKGNTRDQVLTDPTWNQFAHEYQVLVSEVKTPTVNTSELGMAIPGIPFVPLSSWTQKLKLSSPLVYDFPKESPTYLTDKSATEKKRSEAINALNKISSELKNLSDAQVADQYSKIITREHFLELIFEVVFSNWVKAENQILLAKPEKQIELKRGFLVKADKAIQEVIKILQTPHP